MVQNMNIEILRSKKPLYVDAHTHFYEYSDNQISAYSKIGIIFLGVSDDIESSMKTIELSKVYQNLIPCIGVHPWTFNERKIDILSSIQQIEYLINNFDIRCLGEVGLDKRYGLKTYELQKEFFTKVLELAFEYSLLLNLHTLDAWNEIFQMVCDAGIKKAIFHWYTGPLNLLEEITAQGYMITINAAVTRQPKHMKVLERVALENVLTESDGPYTYRNMQLDSSLIPNLVHKISEIKEEDESYIKKIIFENLKKILL